MNRPVISEGKCVKCGGEDFLLAEDTTKYTHVKFVGGVPTLGQVESLTPSEADESIRLFCNACGEYHEVPEDLL